MVLFEHSVESKIKDMKFSAMLHGADPKELEDKQPSVEKSEEDSNLLFGDPAEYAKMSVEDKEVLSAKMKKRFMKWAGVKNG